jgi:hypothetical protein
MGQKSRLKKHKQQKNAARPTAGTATLPRPAGISLEQLNATAGRQQTQPRPAGNSQSISYEMVGDLRRDVRRIMLLLVMNLVIVTALYFFDQRSTWLRDAGERSARFLQLQ